MCEEVFQTKVARYIVLVVQFCFKRQSERCSLAGCYYYARDNYGVRILRFLTESKLREISRRVQPTFLDIDISEFVFALNLDVCNAITALSVCVTFNRAEKHATRSRLISSPILCTQKERRSILTPHFSLLDTATSQSLTSPHQKSFSLSLVLGAFDSPSIGASHKRMIKFKLP